MILATLLLEPSMASIVFISILIQLTWLLTTVVWHKEPTNTTLLVIRVLQLMTLDSSIVLMFPSKWFVPLERTPSSPRLASRPVMVLLPTHSLKEPTRVSVVFVSTATATTEELLSRTSCDPFHTGFSGVRKDPFFYL